MSSEFEAQELNIVHDGSDVSILEYGKLTTSLGGMSACWIWNLYCISGWFKY